MMREILFRGKRCDNGEWVEGFYVKNNRVHTNLNSVIFTSIDSILPECFDFYEVEESTVGQFTGLTDKNGKKIFEGDIIKAHYANCQKPDHVEQVVFCDGRFCSEVALVGNGVMRAALPYSAKHIKSDKSIYMEWCEVIGNIHDNPELI